MAIKYSVAPSAADPAWRVDIALGPSRRAAVWIALVAVASAMATVASAIAPIAKAAILLALLAGAIDEARRHVWRAGRGAIRRLVLDLSGRIQVEPVIGPNKTGRIHAPCFVAPWLVVVRWRPEGAWFARTTLLLPDMAGEQDLRKLRVMLRWGAF